MGENEYRVDSETKFGIKIIVFFKMIALDGKFEMEGSSGSKKCYLRNYYIALDKI